MATNFWNIGVRCLQPGGYPMVVVNGATTTGTAASIPFCLPTRPGEGPPATWITLTGSSGITALSAIVQVSYDNGVSWQKYGPNTFDLFANPSMPVTPAAPVGCLLRLSISTFTGTSATISAAAD